MPLTDAEARVEKAHEPLRTPAVLDESTDPAAVIRYLRREVGLSESELAKVIGAEERTIRRWATHAGATVQPRFREPIDDLRDLAAALVDSLPGPQTGNWLRARNRYLERERPLELLSRGGYHRVREAADAYIYGASI